jgi:hypothetical protein
MIHLVVHHSHRMHGHLPVATPLGLKTSFDQAVLVIVTRFQSEDQVCRCAGVQAVLATTNVCTQEYLFAAVDGVLQMKLGYSLFQ